MGSGKNLGNPDSRKSAGKTGLLFNGLSFDAGLCVSDSSGYRPCPDSFVMPFSFLAKGRGVEADSAARRARPKKEKHDGCPLLPFDNLDTRYTYDQLNRILRADYANVSKTGGLTNTAKYYSSYGYDPDGNLQKLVRNGGKSTLPMDSLVYHYTAAPMYNNRLLNVNDYAADNYDNDIRKNTTTGVSRYMYDPTGNVIKDLVSGQDTIKWNHYDKVTEALKDTSGNGLMFAYDGAGNRYLKAVTSVSGDTTKYDQEYEVRDAQGNVLAVYKGQSVYKGENKSVWVQYIFDDMLHAVSIGQVLSQLAGPVYAQEGHFKNSFLDQAVRSTTWANGQVTAQAVSWYLLRDDAVKVNMLGHTGNYRDFYTSMAAYDDGGGGSLAADALDSLFMVADDAPENFQTFADELLDPKFVPDDVQAQALTKLCAEEELMSQVMDRLGLRYDGKDCAGDVSQLQSYIADNGVPGFADTWFEACRDLQKDFFNYLQGMATDGDLMGNTVYTGAEGSLLPSLQKALTDWCPANRLGGFMDQWESAQSMMLSTNSLEALLADVYNDDPATLMQSYVTNQGKNDAIVSALSAIPYLTPSALIHAGELHLSWYHSVTLYQQILKYQRIWLASHVIYGSSRLGTKDYLPGQLYSLMDYEQAQPVIDSSVLNAKRPWYSAKYGDNIKPGATTAWGNTQTDPYGAAEEAGSKQYELTNQLGNVQTTVGDNRYAVADESTDTIKAFHPVIRSAYDYYPFGMLMPGRYVSDTSQHCVTISRPTWAWKEVTVACWDVYAWRWPGYTPINKGTAVVSGDAVEINAPAAGDGVSFDFPVTANVQQELDIDIERVSLNNKASVQIMEQEGEDWVTLAEVPINVVSGGMTIPFTPKANTVRIIWNGPILVWVRKDCISKLEWVEDDQLVTICDGDKDKYRFGFNGKEKINEWAGIGNYLDFGARGLDSRTGRWLAKDPLSVKYSYSSPYAFPLNSPLWAKDPDGKVVVFINGNYYDGSGGKPDYWHTMKTDVVGKRSERDIFGRWSDETITMKREYDFDEAIMNSIGDHKHIYRDGGLGGWALPGKVNMSADKRKQAGYKQGVSDAPSIIAHLKRDKDGKITETIKVVAHSMGAAYAKGWDNGVLDYAEQHNIKGVKIEYELDFSPFQPNANANNAVKRKGMGATYQFSHKGDGIAGTKPEAGAKQVGTSDDDPSGGIITQHGTGSYENSEKKVDDIAKQASKESK